MNEVRRFRPGRWGLATVGALVLLASACGSDNKSSSSAATTTKAPAASAASTAPASTTPASAAPGTTASSASSAAAATKDPVTVVGLLDQSGVTPIPPGTSEVVKATVAAINAEGGLAGHPINLQIVDTKGDAAAAQSAVAALSDKKPVAVLLSSPPTETAISDALSKVGVPIVGVGYSPSVWGGSFGPANCKANVAYCAKPNFLTFATTFGGVVAEQVIGAQAAGAKTLAVAACSEVDSCSSAAPVFDAVAKSVGLTSVGTTKVSSTASDYSGPCIAWTQQNVDFIQISGPSALGINLMKSCGDQGYKGLWGASAGTVSGDLVKQHYTLAGGLNTFPWWVDDAPAAKYRDIMTKAGVTADQYGGAVQTGMYSALRLLQKGVNDHADATKPLDGAAALAAMYQVSNESLGGLIVPVTFTAANLDRAQNCFWPYVKDANNKFTNPAGGLKTQCFPPPQ